MSKTQGAMKADSINSVANRFLMMESTPKAIHDALQNVLTKDAARETIAYRSKIVRMVRGYDKAGEPTDRKVAPVKTDKSETSVSFNKNDSFTVKPDTEAAIFNILVLLPIFGTAAVKKILQLRFDLEVNAAKKNATENVDKLLSKELNKEYFKLYLSGVNELLIKQIRGMVLDKTFDVFKSKLPNPYDNTQNSSSENLHMVRHLFGSYTFDWFEAFFKFKEAERHYENKQLPAAIAAAESIEETLPIPLVPVSAALQRWRKQLADVTELNEFLSTY